MGVNKNIVRIIIVFFGELRPHATFQNPASTSGRKEHKKKKNIGHYVLFATPKGLTSLGEEHKRNLMQTTMQ